MDGINNFSLVYAEQLGAIKQFSGGMEGFKSATTAFVEGLPALLGTGVAGAKLALTAMTELYDGIKKLPIIGDIVKDGTLDEQAKEDREVAATNPNQVIQKVFESLPPCGPSSVGTCASIVLSRLKK
jgi:hypothetical protein